MNALMNSPLADMSSQEIIVMLAPLILLQLSFALFCLYQIWTKGVANLNKWIWSAIVVFVNLLGPIAFLLFGRKRWATHD